VATTHGQKKYCQILLDQSRFELVERLADEAGIRPNAWVREAVYKQLERTLPSSVYQEAAAKDAARWRESVRKRVEGRAPKSDKS